MTDLKTNFDSLSSPELVGVYHVHAHDGRKHFSWRAQDPCLSMDRSYPLTKADFAKAHGEGADLDRFAKAYGLNNDRFLQTMRTVGTGVHVLMVDNDGSVTNPLVARTQTGEDGTVNLGKHSRAAGGAKGSLSASAYRELQEELIITRQTGDGITIYNLDYDDDALPARAKEAILAQKHREVGEILQANGLSDSNIRFETLKGQVVAVHGVTENIVQEIDYNTEVLRHRLLKDNPKSGDFAACDVIVCARLPDGIKSTDLRILDGERDQSGKLLKREWRLKTPDAWKEDIQGGLPVSPAARPFYEQSDKISAAVGKLRF